MKILIADKLSEQALAALKVAGLDADFRPDLSADELPAAIAGFNVLVVRSTKVTAGTISAADSLSLIVRAGAGVKVADSQASRTDLQAGVPPGDGAGALREGDVAVLGAAEDVLAFLERVAGTVALLIHKCQSDRIRGG